MKDRLTELMAMRRLKQKIYNDTPSYSWKKKLHQFELDIIDGKIKIEKLKRQYR